MSQPVKLAGQLPSEYRNGLIDIVRELVKDPTSQRLALVVYDVKRVEEDVDADAKVPTVRVLRIESALPLDREAAWAMLQRAQDARNGTHNGVEPIPFGIDGDRYENED